MSSAGSGVLGQMSNLYNLSESSIIVLAGTFYVLCILLILALVSICAMFIRRSRTRKQEDRNRAASEDVEDGREVFMFGEEVENENGDNDPPPEYFEALKIHYRKFWSQEDYCCTPPPQFSSLIP